MGYPKRSLLIVGHSLLPTFGPNFVKCYTFRIQTTAYHPESNCAVERLYRRLKDALSARATAATWSCGVTFVLLGRRAQPREDTGLYPAEAVFGALIVLPNEFSQGDEFSVDVIVLNFKKTLDDPPFSLSRHNSSAQLPAELLRWGGVVPPLHRPYAVLRLGPCSFTIRVRSRDEVVSVSRLKACTEADAMPGSP